MIKDSGHCFACGKDNPHGLRLEIRKSPEGVEFDFTPPKHLQGWHGVLHGGVTATLLDELMAWACTEYGLTTVTAELSVRFRRPIPIDRPLHGIGRVLKQHGRLVLAQSQLLDQTGTLLADAIGKMMAVKETTTIQ